MFKDATSMLLGQVGVKVIAFFGTLAAVRSLGPVELGHAAMISTVAGALGTVTNLGADILGPRSIIAEDTDHEKKATSLSLLVLKYAYFRAPQGDAPSFVYLGVMGALLMIANSLNTQILFQGFGLLRKFTRVQLAAAGGAVAGNILIANFWPTAHGYLAVQAIAALTATATGLWLLKIHPSNLCCINLRSKLGVFTSFEGRSAWLSSVVTFIFSQGDILSLSIWRSPLELGNFNAGLTLISATNGIVIILPMVVYSRQLLWLKKGRRYFGERQNRLMKFICAFGATGGLFAGILGGEIAKTLLGERFALAPPVFAVALSLSLVNLPYGVMVSAMNAAGKTWENLKINMCISGFALILYPLGAIHFGIAGVLVVKTAMVALMALLQWRVYRVFIGVNEV